MKLMRTVEVTLRDRFRFETIASELVVTSIMKKIKTYRKNGDISKRQKILMGMKVSA